MGFDIWSVIISALFTAIVLEVSHYLRDVATARPLPEGEGVKAQPRPPGHVHTYRRRSTEENAGYLINIYRCDICGDIGRTNHAESFSSSHTLISDW